jgi:hypothetical protein
MPDPQLVPIRFISLGTDGETVSSEAELARKCGFRVLVPGYWPEECGERVFKVLPPLAVPPALLDRLPAARYTVTGTGPAMLVVVGCANVPDQQANSALRRVDGLTWPTLVEQHREHTHLIVRAGTRSVHVFASDLHDEALRLAASLREVDGLPPK